MPHIGRAVLQVGDLDRALEFVTRAFGFRALFDEEIAPGFRALHVGPGDPHEAGVWLFPVEEVNVTGEPALVLHTSTFDDDLGRIRTSAASFRDVAGAPGGRHLSVSDPWGNVIVLAEVSDSR